MKTQIRVLLMFTIGIVLLLSSSCKKEDKNIPMFLYKPGNGVTDSDGNSYKTIIVNDQEWMAENLKTTKYCDGSPIEALTTIDDLVNTTEGAWTHYNFDNAHETPYGKLYNWYAVADEKNLCPCGWRVPSNDDWDKFISFLGGDGVAGDKMKIADKQYWDSHLTTPTNLSGFSAYPGGTFSVWTGPEFSVKGSNAYWWSKTEHPEDNSAWHYYIGNSYSDISKHQRANNKVSGMSVRCIKN